MGSNREGQLGDGTTTASARPRRVVGVEDAVDLAAGMSHACVITRGGALRCWGGNRKGQLGDGTRIDRHAPIEVRW
jgi:alpha-tubulin suppressor-like RCC1 family protein